MKWLIYIVIIWLVWRIAKRWDRQREHASRPDAAAAERMVRCAQCDVGLPVSEALSRDGRFYCCQEHLQQAVRPGDSVS